MLNNGNKKCEFNDEIVAYIYDEIGQTERTKFESHLADCSVCTDEFAGISNARFSVFEWQKEEFAHLSTPEIVIPYAPKQSKAENAGFFAGLRDMLTLSGWSSAVAVAGAVVVCIGLGFIAMNYVGPGQQIASNTKVEVSAPVIKTDVAKLPDSGSVNTEVPDLTEPAVKTTNNRDIKPVRASVRENRNSNPGSPKRVIASPSQQTAKAPVLSSYDDDDDKSLRLTDLFDEGGV